MFEYKRLPNEAFFSLHGPAAAEVMTSLFSGRLEPAVLQHLRWAEDAPAAAVCWLPPDRLEIRVPAQAGWPERLAERLEELADTAFKARLQTLIDRVEAWGYADIEVSGAEDIAAELTQLAASARSSRTRREVERARDALDDGLPAETVAAALYRARSAG